jgi:multiple sugar transport system permease protein
MLIWLAGLKNIPAQLYEASELDGAGTLRQFFHITLPMISPYIFFNTVMGLIGTLQVFEAAYIMTNGGPQKSTLFYAYYLFNKAFRELDMGTASALAWILFIVVIALTGMQVWFARKWVHYE